jgi:hypothetical protein
MRKKIEKIWPSEAQFFRCGACDHWHALDLPGTTDCRDDARRFTTDELDDKYPDMTWEQFDGQQE